MTGAFFHFLERQLNYLNLCPQAGSSQKAKAAGIEPVSSETQWEKLERLTSATDPVAAYLQLLNDTHGHRLAQTELDLAFLLTRWPNLPQHIRQTIMTLVRSVGRMSEESVDDVRDLNKRSIGVTIS